MPENQQVVIDAPDCPSELGSELRRVKAWFPFRIVWGYMENDEPMVFAHFNKRGMNTAIRKGITVYTTASNK